MRRLLQLHYAPTAVWSPDSSELLANTATKTQKCWSTWRVPVDGSKPTLISSCKLAVGRSETPLDEAVGGPGGRDPSPRVPERQAT